MASGLQEPRLTVPLPVVGSGAESGLERWPTRAPWGRVSQEQHSQFLLSYFPPPLEPSPRHILYVGSGTEGWARELRARYFPKATVWGLEQQKPARAGASGVALPQEFPYPAARFDLVQLVLQLPAIPRERLPSVLTEALRVLRPAGMLQVIEAGCGYGPPAFTLLYEWLRRALAQEGIALSTAYHLESLLESAGFQAIRQIRVDFPVGSYAGHMGVMAAQLAAHVLERLLPTRLAHIGVNEAGYGYAREAAQAEWAGQAAPGQLWLPALQPYFSVVGQKPASSEAS
jgi:SAM-dependent methyltransferase